VQGAASDGRTSIPSDRAASGLLKSKPGDRVKVFVHPDDSAVRLPKLTVSALRGIVAARRRTVTIDEMDQAVAEAAVDAVPRAKRR
jgi:hypothetical protein